MSASFELTVGARRGWQALDSREVVLYLELLASFISSDLKIRYRRTLVGGLSAMLQPFVAIVMFPYLFKQLKPVQSDGPPYQLFAYAGLAPWTFFTTSVAQSSSRLIANPQLGLKVYSPRRYSPQGGYGGVIELENVGMSKHRWQREELVREAECVLQDQAGS